MSLEALELQIERLWVALTELPAGERRTLHLIDGRLVIGSRATKSGEVGTYGREVKLSQLRDDVFWALDRGRE